MSRAGARPASLTRDRLTVTGYAGLGTWAWFLYGFGALLPLLRVEEGISRSVLGLHSLALASGGAIAGVAVVPLAHRVHRRGCFTVATVLLTCGSVVLVASRQPAVTIPAVALVGTGGSMLVNTSAAALSEHHEGTAPAAISEANAYAAGVGLLAPAAVGGAVALGWTWRPAALLVVPMAIGLLLLVRRVAPGTPALDGVPGPAPAGGRLPTQARLLMLLVVCCVGIEFCCTAWSADLLRQRTGLSAGAASAGVTAVVAGMCAGRFAVGRLALRYAPRRLLLASLLVTTAGWAAMWVPSRPGPVLAGLVLTGVGISAHYPLGSALVYGAAPGQADRATGRLSLGIAVAAGGAPFALGTVADATSTHTAFLAVPILVVAALAVLGGSVRHGRRRAPTSAVPFPAT